MKSLELKRTRTCAVFGATISPRQRVVSRETEGGDRLEESEICNLRWINLGFGVVAERRFELGKGARKGSLAEWSDSQLDAHRRWLRDA